MEEPQHVQVVTGLIVTRRCYGKHLSFASIRPLPENNADDSNTNNDDTNHDSKVVFRRAYFKGENFPIKTSDLPYGAHVSLNVTVGTTTTQEALQVTSWSMLAEDPKTQALRVAKEGEGVSCSTYLQVRANAYFSLNEKREDRSPKPQSEAVDESSASPHGNPRAKSLRAKLFCQWLLEHVLGEAEEEAVLDVAGGKGQLSVQLAASGISCTVMDPLIRKSARRFNKDKSPNFLPSSFSQNNETASLLEDYTCLLGLHPDECTEDILDMALRMNKKVAIIPCCVFPSLFPLRKLCRGKVVQSYDDFLEYLLEKDDRLRRATLPFDGKNQVIYLSRA
jgi:hypothetical protein